MNTIASILRKNMLSNLLMEIICFLRLTVFLALRTRKTTRILEQVMSADKYLCIFSRQIEIKVYLFHFGE